LLLHIISPEGAASISTGHRPCYTTQVSLATGACPRYTTRVFFALVIVRWTTDRWALLVISVFGARCKTKTEGTEYVLIYQIAQNVGRFGFADAFWRSSCRLAPTLFTKKARRSVAHLTISKCVFRSHCRRVRRRNRPAVGYPPYICQHVLAFLPNSFGFLMHLGGRDTRVPVRRRYAANLCGITRSSPCR
jgi:hypothetical protein